MRGQAVDTTQRGAVFSADGYAVSQACAQQLPYGRYGSHYNGCGWMAAYNILHALRQAESGHASQRSCAALPNTCAATAGRCGETADICAEKDSCGHGSTCPVSPAVQSGDDGAVSADAVRTGWARGLWFGGKLGTGPLRFARYLRARGLRVRVTARRTVAFRRAQSCRAGAVLYWSGHGAHYVAFAPLDASGAAQRGLRFFNVAPGAAQDAQTLAAFCARTCEKTPALFFTVE